MTTAATLPAPINIGSLIVSTPEVVGGRPRIAGTRVSVQRIVGWHKQGLSAEEILGRFGHLTLAQIYAALTYYHANKAEIEQYLAEEAEACEALQAPDHSGHAA